MRHVIVHYHIFKNAGTTFAATLRRNFGRLYADFDRSRYDARLTAKDLTLFLQEHPTLLAVSSHHLRLPKPTPTESLTVHDVLFVRNPIDRIRSMYDFYHRTWPNGDPLTMKAKILDVRSFLGMLLDEQPQLVSNAQLNLIANGGERHPVSEDLQRAASLMRSAAAIGVTDEFQQCCITAEYQLRRFFPCLDLTYVPQNVGQGFGKRLTRRIRQFARACGARLYDRLLAQNLLDFQLVALAAAEARARLEQLPIGPWQSDFVRRMQTVPRGPEVADCHHLAGFWTYLNG